MSYHYQDVWSLYHEQDDPPGPKRYMLCRPHNTVFEEGGICDLCEETGIFMQWELCDDDGIITPWEWV